MSTNLFRKYYDNPTKSYIYSNIVCNSASGDETSFEINGSEGQITTNSDKIAGLDLSDVNVALNQYTNEMRIIEPNSFIYIKGMLYGDTYASKTYGRILGELIRDEYWMYKSVLFFVIKYKDSKTGARIVRSLKCSGEFYDEDSDSNKTFIEVINEYFKEKDIQIEVTYSDGYITFTSTELSYNFWIDHVMFWSVANDDHIIEKIDQWMEENGKEYEFGWDDRFLEANNIPASNPYTAKNVYSSVIKKSDYSRLYNLFNCLNTQFNNMLEDADVKKIWLFEDFKKSVSPMKYRNGAMKGFLVKATYPVYNADNIQEYQKSLKVVHLMDRVEEWYTIPESAINGRCVGVKKIMDVVDSYHSEYDDALYDRWMGYYSHIDSGDFWIDADEIPQVVPEMFDMWSDSHVSYETQALSIYKDIEDREAMGLSGFCAYASKHGLWKNMGQLYCMTTVADDEDFVECRNLIPGFIIYNPNSFPVTVNYITFG